MLVILCFVIVLCYELRMLVILCFDIVLCYGLRYVGYIVFCYCSML